MTRRDSEACRQARDALAHDGGNESMVARHLESCEDCRAEARLVETLRDAVLSADDTLDELTRARVQAKLADAMAEALSPRPSGLGRRAWMLGAIVASLALVLGLSVGIWRERAARRASSHRDGEVATIRRVMLPYAFIDGSSPWPDSTLRLGQPVDRIELPAGVAVRASLATGRGGAQLTLYGPVDVTVEEVASELIGLRLDRGILVGEYDGRRGGTLRIRSPGATTEVVGTLFSVEAHDGHSRVSVSHGTVQVRREGHTVAVTAGESYSTREARVGGTPPSVTALFARHEPLAAAVPAPLPRVPPAPPASTEAAPAPPPPARDIATISPVAPRASQPPPPPSPHDGPRSSPSRRGAANAPAAAADPSERGHGPPGTNDPAVKEKEATTEAAAEPEKPAQPEAPTASYRAAEVALRAGDETRARALLAEGLQAHPDHPLADSARYELALLLVKGGQRREAESVLSGIGARSVFAEPGQHLRCRVLGELGDMAQAASCFRAFRRSFPGSPHDADALDSLLRLAAAGRDCDQVATLAAEMRVTHPGAAQVDEARRLEADCRR